jgi:hypothetical protein
MKHVIKIVAFIGALIVHFANIAFAQTIAPTAGNNSSADVPRIEMRPRGIVSSAAPGLGVGSSSRSQDSVPPVIVGFGGKDAAAMETMEQDLAIMNRVFDRALERGLGEDAPTTKLGVQLLYTGGSRSVRALYLEGFGALFMIKVNFPLTGAVLPEEKMPEKSADSEWERARRELLGREEFDEMSNRRSSTAIFDQDQVERLKEVIMQALKDASHMRGLKPDEFVSISVFGPGSFAGKARTSGGGSAAGLAGQLQNRFAYPYQSSAGSGTVMTLRVKKADIDAFAEGKLSPGAFKGKVTTHSYAGSGHDITSVNSWTQGHSLIFQQTR